MLQLRKDRPDVSGVSWTHGRYFVAVKSAVVTAVKVVFSSVPRHCATAMMATRFLPRSDAFDCGCNGLVRTKLETLGAGWQFTWADLPAR